MVVAEPIERNVEEVHCAECGVPMSSIPNWYANVKVRFTCDACRQKSPRLNALPTLDTAVRRPSALGEDADGALEEVEAELEADPTDEIEVELEDAEPSETSEE